MVKRISKIILQIKVGFKFFNYMNLFMNHIKKFKVNDVVGTYISIFNFSNYIYLIK